LFSIAGVLHHFPVCAQPQRAHVLPRLGERLRVVDDHFVGDVPEVGPRKALRSGAADRCADARSCPDGSCVEVHGVDDQRVALPMSHRVAEPRRLALAVRAAVDRHHGETMKFCSNRKPRYLSLWMNCIGSGVFHRAGHAERQAGAGIVAVRASYAFHSASPHGVNGRSAKPCCPLPSLDIVGDVGFFPDAAEVHLAGCGTRCRSGRRLVGLPAGREQVCHAGRREEDQQRCPGDGFHGAAISLARPAPTIRQNTLRPSGSVTERRLQVLEPSLAM